MKTSEHLKDGKHMQLVRLKRAAQITLPPELRQQFGLGEGDYLEVISTKDGVLLKPVSVVARKPKASTSSKHDTGKRQRRKNKAV
jgi:AbrB family looped-hinge helix DNA binding protein